MIPKKARAGGRTTGLLYYLYGPGKKDEHTRPHLVAAWDDSIIPVRDPALSESATLPALARLLDAPVESMDGTRPSKHVYHVPVRLAPEDRALTDAEWNTVAREMMDAAGIAPADDPARSCRWIAMRHADDHIHIVATLATEEGRQPTVRRDMPKMQARARQLETRFGLRRLVSGDKTAARWPTAEELGKAARHGREETARSTLNSRVRQAAAGATNEADFFSRLAGAGVRVKQRIAPDGNVTGYSVALPGDRTAQGRAVWYSGSRLAPDLSLPRVRERWSRPVVATSARPASRTEAWRRAAEHVDQAAATLVHSGDAEGAGAVAALSDALTSYAAEAPGYVRSEVRAAAGVFERAGRAPAARRARGQAHRHLSEATRSLTAGAMLAGFGGEAAAAVELLHALTHAVLAAHRWHQARQYRMQAEGAAVAGGYLRAAGEVATGALTGGRGRPRGLHAGHRGRPSAESMERFATVVRDVLPGRAEDVIADDAYAALAATLQAAESAGYEPRQVLGEVAAQRELGTAESVAQVLTWRMQGRMRRDEVTPPKVAAPKAVPAPAPGPTRPARDRQQAPAPRAPEEARRNRPRGPSR